MSNRLAIWVKYICNPLKFKEDFKYFSLRRKHGVQVGVLVICVGLLGGIALQGLYRVYSYSYPLATIHFPVASHVLSLLHSLEVSRSLVIQYALERDPQKLAFLKKSYDSESSQAERELSGVEDSKELPSEIRSHWEAILKTQGVFSDGSLTLMKAQDERLTLFKERMDQIQEANHLVEQMVERFGTLTDRFSSNHEIQFLTIGAQVVLLEQRYLYQPSLSTPLSLNVEQAREEEKNIIQNKEKFRLFAVKFNQNLERLVTQVPKKEEAPLKEISKFYKDYLERVQGEDGIFLISEDENAKLSTVGLQLEKLQSSYEEGAEASRAIQKIVYTRMKDASHAIASIKASSLVLIVGMMCLMMIVGVWFGRVIARFLIEPIEHMTSVSQHLSEGKFEERVHVSSQDEMGQLAEQFNVMADNFQKWNETLEKKVQERTTALAKANEMKSQFLTNISHDLKTPLNAILGFTQVVLTDPKGKLTEQQVKNLNAVMKSGKELLQLITLILEFSRLEEGKLGVVTEEFLFEPLLDECLEQTEVLLNRKPVTILKEIQTHLPKLKTDRPKIKRILLNILSNAAKFTAQGHIKVSVKQEEKLLMVTVEDTGPGIAKENLLTLFDEYKTRNQEREEGNGFGLSITKRLVTVLGGSISIKSELGQGALFTVQIPFTYAMKEINLKEAA